MLELILAGVALSFPAVLIGADRYKLWRKRRDERQLPRYTAVKLAALTTPDGGGYRGGTAAVKHDGRAIELSAPARACQPLVAPLSRQRTLGYLLEVRIAGERASLAVGKLARIVLGSGPQALELSEGPALLAFDAPISGTAWLVERLPDPELEQLFRQRGLDARWAARRKPLELIERCLPEAAEVWVGGTLEATSSGSRVIGGNDQPRWLSLVDPARLSAEAGRLLLAQRDDAFVDELTPPSRENGDRLNLFP